MKATDSVEYYEEVIRELTERLEISTDFVDRTYIKRDIRVAQKRLETARRMRAMGIVTTVSKTIKDNAALQQQVNQINMKPLIGLLVILKLTAEQKKQLGGNHESSEDTSNGEAPAIIVRAWGTAEGAACNLKVFGDSGNNLWVTSATEGDQEGQWRDPNPKVEATVAETTSEATTDAKAEAASI